MRVRCAPGMRPGAFLTLVRPAPKLAPPRCSRVRRAVKREAGRVLRTEIANLRCPRNGKRPRRMTQAGSGAFRVQVARGRGPLRVKTRGKASRYAASPDTGRGEEPARLHDARPAGKRGAQCFTGLVFDADPNRSPAARCAPRCAVRRRRAGCGIRRSVRIGDLARRASRGAAIRRVACRGAVAEPIVLDGDASATPVDPMGRLPLYCAERRPRERAARRIAAVCAAICAVVSRRLDRRGTCRHVARRARRNADSGGRSPHAVSCVDGGESRVRLRVAPEPCAQ